MRGWEGEDGGLVHKQAVRQVARKTLSNGQFSRDMISGQQQNQVKSRGRLAKRNDGMSDDDRETNDQLFGDYSRRAVSVRSAEDQSDGWGLPPSKRGDNNRARASPKGDQQPVSSSVTATSEMETRVQHEPGRWGEPSFMRVAWLSWKELGGILEETYLASCRQ